jgi:hypothetical protein
MCVDRSVVSSKPISISLIVVRPLVEKEKMYSKIKGTRISSGMGLSINPVSHPIPLIPFIPVRHTDRQSGIGRGACCGAQASVAWLGKTGRCRRDGKIGQSCSQSSSTLVPRRIRRGSLSLFSTVWAGIWERGSYMNATAVGTYVIWVGQVGQGFMGQRDNRIIS